MHGTRRTFEERARLLLDLLLELHRLLLQEVRRAGELTHLLQLLREPGQLGRDLLLVLLLTN